MSVPTTITDAVSRLRELGAAARTDVFDGLAYWTDEQLYEHLQPLVRFTAYQLYPVDKTNLIFRYNAARSQHIDTSTIVIAGTTETPTYDTRARTVTFPNAVTTTVTITTQMYDLYEAATKLWERKANQRFSFIRIKGGANQMFLEQEYEHCLARAAFYRSLTVRRHKKASNWF